MLAGQEGINKAVVAPGEEPQGLAIKGLWDHAFPVSLVIQPFQEECLGYLEFGNKDARVHLEGECTDERIELYEFDQHARVSGVLEGQISETDFNLTWSNYNNSIKYDFSGRLKEEKVKGLQVFSVKGESKYDMLLLWPEKNKIYVVNKESDILSWQQYNCPHAPYACQFSNGENEVESLSISDRILSAGSRLFEYSETVDIKHQNGYDFGYFYNYTYPVLGDSKFDYFIEEQVNKYRNNFLNALPESEEKGPDSRLINNATGDFYLTLISDDLISGFLTFRSSTQPRLETVAFSYDRMKHKFYRIQEIWEKDFDYAFYLKKTLENRKRNIVQTEEPIVRDILKEHPFAHFVLSTKGVLFFTDYNSIYGRRLVLLPYDEIAGFIKNKGLSNLINQK